MLQVMVASLLEKVSAGEQQLQETNQCLAKQEATAKVLTDQVAALWQELYPAVETSLTIQEGNISVR
jgi:hypothetical protein